MKRYIIMLLGAFTIGIGVVPVISANLGADALSTLEQALTVTFPISLPVAQIIVNASFIILLLVFAREKVGLDTCLCPLAIAFGSTVALNLLSFIFTGLNPYILLPLGMVIIGLGIGIGSMSETGSNPYDGFVLYLAEKSKISYSILRSACDLLMLAIGILLKGTFGIGTIIAICLQGVIANFFVKILKNVRV